MHRLKPVPPKTKTAADGCRFLDFSLGVRILLKGHGSQGQFATWSCAWAGAKTERFGLFAGEGELVAVGVFEDATGAPFFLLRFHGEVDAFGF
jgi:hypothetical protein